jgi:fermentation-respiration switch protein FrsA (DUF1100 family)
MAAQGAFVTALKTFLLIAVIGYAALLGLMYVAQRSLQYFPDTVRVAPAEAGLPQAEEVVLDTRDGEKVIVWHAAPREGRPVILYFQGNGAGLRHRAHMFAKMVAEGAGVVALSYRGYGGSTGSPTEDGLIDDARAAYDFAVARYPAERIVLWGESLGSGVAVALAAEKAVARVALQAPFSSAADVGAAHYPYLPVRWLMKDQFRSDERIARVTAPVLIVHGERDGVVPIRFGERLHELVKSPKQFVRLAGADHNDLDRFGATEAILEFLTVSK